MVGFAAASANAGAFAALVVVLLPWTRAQVPRKRASAPVTRAERMFFTRVFISFVRGS
jgi:hypothetical protein